VLGWQLGYRAYGEGESPKGDEQALPGGDDPLEQGAIKPVRGAAELVGGQLASDPAHQQGPPEVQIAQQPLLVYVTKDDELSTFERRTVFFGIVGLLLATLSMVAAVLAGFGSRECGIVQTKDFANAFQNNDFAKPFDSMRLGANNPKTEGF
jgi:hypothetical protein